ncbi:MAG: hypothetical protein CMQ02_00210 [Gammaproteobacteria bacterium]|jgi:hypothetical protein|nr:hypothetical protein [Gammaproteobacteria bacterium]|tara:strand:- start:412 stop:786 length:375 start_codon:yes stop_codon:yes gene_type:complete
MINRIRLIATNLRKFRVVYWFICIASLGVILWRFLLSLEFGSDLQLDGWFFPSIVAGLWGLTALSFQGIFSAIPEDVDSNASWRNRFVVWVVKMFFWPLSLIFLLLMLAVVFLSYQLLRLWFFS